MTNDIRSAVVGYCNIGVGNEMSGRTQLVSPLHPRLKWCYNYLLPMFDRLIVNEHDLLKVETHRERFLQYCVN